MDDEVRVAGRENRESFRAAFADLANQGPHPEAAEIGAALDGAGSLFAIAEVKAHLGWCEACHAVALEYEKFRSTPGARDDDAWAAMRQRLPAAVRQRPKPRAIPWLAVAAGLTLVLIPAAWWIGASRGSPPELVARAAVVDLMPSGEMQRGAAKPAAAAASADSEWITVILNGAQAERALVRVRSREGRELWSRELHREKGVYALTLSHALVAPARPLTIECGTQQYLLE